jgi:hypothetical protein
MRKLLLCLLFVPLLAIASEIVEIDKKVSCSEIDKIIPKLKEVYNEELVWVGAKEKSYVAVFTNPVTQTWTVIQFNNDVGCVLEVGSGYQFNFKDRI